MLTTRATKVLLNYKGEKKKMEVDKAYEIQKKTSFELMNQSDTKPVCIIVVVNKLRK